MNSFTKSKAEVRCSECGGFILSNADLVVTWRWFVVRPFHRECYVEALRDERDFFVGNHIINSWSGDMTARASLVLAPLLALFAYAAYGPLGALFFFAACLIQPAVRFYSWWRYERHLY